MARAKASRTAVHSAKRKSSTRTAKAKKAKDKHVGKRARVRTVNAPKAW
jgi:hypothetical protein